MGEILTQTIIESEEAHFKQNCAPRLRLIQANSECVEIAAFENWVRKSTDELLYQKAHFESAKVFFEPRFGYVAVKYMIENLAEFILHRKHYGKRLRADEIFHLRMAICRNETMKSFWDGANLGMILEKDDALSDRELYYLITMQEEHEPLTENKLTVGPLNSYPEMKLQQLFEEFKNSYQTKVNERKSVKESIGLISTLMLIPLIWFIKL